MSRRTEIPSSEIPSSTLRGILRLVALVVMTLLLLPFCAVTLTLASAFGRSIRERMVMALTPPVLGALAASIGLHVHIVGKRDERVKVFVGNHVSYLDILVAGIGVGGVFVSRHDVKDWPVIGLFARLAGTVFIDRRSIRSAIVSSADIGERVSRGVRISLFPEGGTTAGFGVGTFKAFLFGSIAGTGALVQPFTIRYERFGGHPVTPENRELVYWFDPAPSLIEHGWRLLKLPPLHVSFIFGEPVPAPAASDKDAIRELSELLRARVAAGLGLADTREA